MRRAPSFLVGLTGRGGAEACAAAYARAGSGEASAGPPPATKSRERTSAYPATEPTAATATLTSAIVLKPVTNAWCGGVHHLVAVGGRHCLQGAPGPA